MNMAGSASAGVWDMKDKVRFQPWGSNLESDPVFTNWLISMHFVSLVKMFGARMCRFHPSLLQPNVSINSLKAGTVLIRS